MVNKETEKKVAGDQIIAWNTGRTYTEKGQRIGAIKIGDGVFMSDQDRGIHCYLPDCKLEQGAIMHRYDYNIRLDWGIPNFTGNRWELIEQLNAVSRSK
jgi:hypothetical protein